VEEELHPPPSRDDDPSDRLPQVEHTLLSVWRRTVTEGGGPQLTLAEAAALLGSSVDSVRRRIKAGQIRAFRDRRGRIRVDASVTYDPFEEDYVPDATDSEAVGRLWEELKQVRAKLEESETENARLLNELQATENALEYTKTEVANLWRAMTTRNVRQTQIEYPSPTVDHTVVLDFAQERHRIQGKIADVRSLARRRKWPWPQTG
jgi:excisionase family DNA binding protein